MQKPSGILSPAFSACSDVLSLRTTNETNSAPLRVPVVDVRHSLASPALDNTPGSTLSALVTPVMPAEGGLRKSALKKPFSPANVESSGRQQFVLSASASTDRQLQSPRKVLRWCSDESFSDSAASPEKSSLLDRSHTGSDATRAASVKVFKVYNMVPPNATPHYADACSQLLSPVKVRLRGANGDGGASAVVQPFGCFPSGHNVLPLPVDAEVVVTLEDPTSKRALSLAELYLTPLQSSPARAS